MSYGLLDGDGYKHGAVKHGAKERAFYDYRKGVWHHPTAWKASGTCSSTRCAGAHIRVSNKWVGNYLREFTFRANNAI